MSRLLRFSSVDTTLQSVFLSRSALSFRNLDLSHLHRKKKSATVGGERFSCEKQHSLFRDD